MTTIRTSDGLDLHLHDWTVDDPTITVLLLHGYGEHAGRYEATARRWHDQKISTLAVDLRGHGLSPGARGYVERFTDYHRDADALYEETKRRGGGPIALFGHSMGGLLALHWLLSGRGSELKGVVLSSPYLGLALKVSGAKIGLAKVMSRVYGKFAEPSGLAGKHVTRDKELAALYDSDPLNNSKAAARWFTESNEAMASVHRRAGQLKLPLLLLYGGDDRVASADANDRFASALTGSDKTCERLEGHYHELLNEPPEYRHPIADRMSKWLVDHAGGSAT